MGPIPAGGIVVVGVIGYNYRMKNQKMKLMEELKALAAKHNIVILTATQPPPHGAVLPDTKGLVMIDYIW